jgi:hypothetical protein
MEAIALLVHYFVHVTKVNSKYAILIIAIMVRFQHVS